MAKAKGLGRGLDALFGDEAGRPEPQGIRIGQIEQSPHQPRRNFDPAALAELAESIRQNGVITPIAVRKTGETYQIIAGERRWRAARMAGLTHIPAVVLEVDAATAYQYALVENLQREDLNPMEEAEGYRRLMDDFGLTQEGAAERVGKSRSAVANLLRLLGLPPAVRRMVEAGQLSGGHARALLALESPEAMEAAARRVAEEGLSVRQAEALAKAGPSRPGGAAARKNIYIQELERELAADTGHKVAIRHGAKRGRLTIEYHGNQDLERICLALRGLAETRDGRTAEE